MATSTKHRRRLNRGAHKRKSLAASASLQPPPELDREQAPEDARDVAWCKSTGGGEEKDLINMAKNESKKKERAVIVTTEHRGVFFGYADETDGDAIKLRAARLCIYWSSDMRGFMGLASVGPSKDCKIGPPADITLRKITSVVEVTPQAVEKWEAAPWR